jgi:hypothetical protein
MVAAEALGSTGDAYVELKDYDKAITISAKLLIKQRTNFYLRFT